MRKILLAFLVFLSVPVFAAAQSVTFAPETGEGFVGRTLVQDGFGFNAGQLKKVSSEVSFTYLQEAVYLTDCANGQRIQVSDSLEKGVSSVPVNQKGQFVGFMLIGWNGEEAYTPLPPAKTVCGGDGVIAPLVEVRHTLSVEFDGQSVVLLRGASTP